MPIVDFVKMIPVTGQAPGVGPSSTDAMVGSPRQHQ